MDPLDLERLVSGSEPALLRTWLTPIESGQLMTEGSVTPALGTGWHQQHGLWLPARQPQPLGYIDVYLVLEDYVPGASPDAAHRLAAEIVGTVPRDDLVLTLIALLHAEKEPDLSPRLAREFAAALRPDAAERLLAVTDPRLEHPRRFLSRQGILTAMKAALAAPPTPQGTPAAPLAVAAVLLVHACSMLLATTARSDRDALMMETVRNVDFNQQRDLAARISDHIEMWETYGDRVVPHLSQTAGELVENLIGLDVRDFVAFAFAVGHRAISYEPGLPLLVSAELPGVNRPAGDVDAFLKVVAASPDELAGAYAGMRDGPWNFLPFQRRPVLRLRGGKLAVLDEKMLFDRVTDGLYWDVHDSLRAFQGDEARKAWARGYGDMVEAFVASRFASLAPTGLDGPTYYSEDDLKRAYPRSKVSDGVIDMGAVFVPIEIVSGRLTLASRVYGEPARFRDDTEKIVMKKARQLDAISKALLRDEQALSGRSAVIGRRIQPMLVAGGGYPVEPLSSNYVREEAKRERLFSDSRVLSLAVASIDELSMLVGLAETGQAPNELLAGWQESGIGSLALRNWLLRRFPHAGESFRPSRMQRIWDDFGDELVTRLGLGNDGQP